MGKTRFETPKKTGKPTGSNGSPKVPKASELTDAKVGNSKTKNGQDKDGLIHIYVLSYCEDASVYGAEFEEGDMMALHLVWNCNIGRSCVPMCVTGVPCYGLAADVMA